ncbi:right-handed parallel beta-helix repeat-containing protein [Zobellia galactanivorans]|uniref:Beta-helix fold protein n=1 Tax=Zobellia galactanivorans (strain DSM 12802 / CCUG 47099 / CIP 106680 / NCIMB 13871 / Dsij) TaxID=63186 RepID=G0L984_ZOBGA|nr:right-handed parallel beta-helix repeat-containing protein [Zobellia galactanivorans]CAZ94408.1 Beta-helix fold protein [Zobellia galactanivorans]
MNKKTIVICIGVMLLATFMGHSQLFVSPEGGDNNKGSRSDPTSFEGAIEKASEILKRKGVPKKGLTITLGGGVYRFKKKIVLGPEFKGTEDRPIIIRAAAGESVLFDGSMLISPKNFSAVKAPDELARLSARASNKIMVATITDTTMLGRFNKDLMLNLSYDDVEYLPSVFPNEGYASFVEETVRAEVSPPAIPVGKQDYGVRAGYVPYLAKDKPRGWKGSLQDPRGAQAQIGDKVNEMAGSWQQWENELKRNNTRNQLTGFIEASWLLSSQPVYGADAATKSIHLTRALGYGWAWRKNDKPFRVFGLLCELDRPGEWHFDPLTNRLFVYPPTPINGNTQIGLSVANGFLALDGTRHVKVIGLSVKNVGSGSVYTIKGEHNLVAGAQITNSTAVGVEILGTDNVVKSCDLVDLDVHVRLSGGLRSPDEITPGNNLVENCQIYQDSFKHEKVNIVMNGVGNIFRHNMIHNSLGQAMVVNGNDHLVEYNELFNIGYEEGDGGAIYSGADLGGFGNTYRYNFFHHLMHVPGKVERAGLHLDDGQSGATVIGNVFYKSASKGAFMFGGAGHTVKENVFLEGDRGAYFVQSLGNKMFDIQKEIAADPNHHRKGTKEDYIGRVEVYTGKRGWTKSPWKDKYPLMRTILSDTLEFGRLWPIHIKVEDNFNYANKRGIDKIIDYRVAPEAIAKSSVKNNKEVTPDDFVDYDAMNFAFKDGKKHAAIPFAQIGLYVDSYRKNTPDKTKYRTAIKEHFKGIVSGHPGTLLRIDTAKLVREEK